MFVIEQDKELKEYYLFHNGKKLENIIVGVISGNTLNPYILSAQNRESGETLLSLIDSEPDFPKYERLVIHNWDISSEIKFLNLYEDFKDYFFIFEVLMMDFDIDESEVESLNYLTGLKKREFDIASSSYEKDKNGIYFLKFEFEVIKENGDSFLQNVKSSEEKIRKFCEDSRNKFLERNESNTVFSIFTFPKEIKTNCEQYLLYFAQFLQDLGINSRSNLKEEAGKVLFSVTPTKDVEALDKIREALAVYLNLPSSPIVYDDSFAAMRLQQQVENLQHSQRMTEREIRSSERELRLSQTVIEHQDKVILQKDTIIEQQNKVIEKITSKSIMMDSLENKEEFVKIFDGLEIGESKELKEKIGIKFHPLTSLKTFGKNLIGKNEEITSLNLNDEADKENN